MKKNHSAALAGVTVYRHLLQLPPLAALTKLFRALEQQDLMHVAGYVGNAMEPLVAAEHPEIPEIRLMMQDCGASGTAMTGSGSAVFGIFDSFDMAALASMQLMEKYQTFLSRNV